MTLRAVIMDDEEAAIRLLSSRLTTDWRTDVNVVAGCDTIDKAARAVIQYQPDVVFADIDMREDATGLDFIKMLQGFAPGIQCILVTAQSDAAFYQEAIRLQLTSFLLKPVERNALNNAIDAVWRRISNGSHIRQADELLIVLNRGRRILLRDSFTHFTIYEDEIFCAKAAEHYVQIFLTDGSKRTCSCSIAALEDELHPERFIRAGRSLILNKHYLREVNPKTKSILLKDRQGKPLEITGVKSDAFESALGVLKERRSSGG